MKSGAEHHEITSWIARLFEEPDLLFMGHNQRADDLNLGLGWLYYSFGRILYPRKAVVIGSYRGFVPLVVAKALRDNLEPGSVTFVDPSLVDDFWSDASTVQEYFSRFGLDNVEHFPLTTQEFVETEHYQNLGEVGLLFIDGYHSQEQARFDYEAFKPLLASRGIAVFHDSMWLRRSEIYGAGRGYDVTVKYFIDELKKDPQLQVFDLPFGATLTLVRATDDDGLDPLVVGRFS